MNRFTMQRIKSRSDNKGGFTLIELLVVLAIIGILTSFLVVAIRGARRTAMLRRSESQFEKIRSILQNEIEDLLDQPLMVNLPPSGQLGPHSQATSEKFFTRAERFRIEARRKLLLSRLPYHTSVLRNPNFLAVPYRTSVGAGPAPNQFPGFSIPSYLGNVYSVLDDPNGLPSAELADDPSIGLPANGGDLDNINFHNTESSELLYAVLKSIWVEDEPALSLFRDSEIGDTDGDGLNEILDAFGKPVYFRLQMTLPLKDAWNSSTVVNVNVPLEGVSAWMTEVDIQRVDGTSLTLFLNDFNIDTLDPSRVRVVVTSQETEPFDWNLVFPAARSH